MKILQLINSLEVGGAEKLVVDLASFLSQREGYKCDVIVLGVQKDTIFEKILREKGVHIIYLGYKTIYSAKVIFNLAKYINEYDIVHVHLFPAQLWIVLAKIISRSKVRLITTEHSTSNHRRENKIFRILDRFIYNHYETVISISHDAEKALKKWLNLKKNNFKYRVILNGVNLAYINNAKAIKRDEIGIPFDAILILCIARLETVKNHHMQIEAMSKLDYKYHLVLVGDGSLRTTLEKLVQEFDLCHRVHFAGIRADVASFIQAADIAILTSHWEGLSLACVEGMSCCPFIGTNVDGIRDVVQGAGILIADSDSTSLAEMIKTLATNKEFNTNIKVSCYERAKQFDIHKMIDEYIEILNKK